MMSEGNITALTSMISDLMDEVKSLREKIDTLSENGTSVPAVRRKILNTGQVCMLLDKTPLTIYRMVKRGELVGYKKGKEYYFFEDEVMKILESARVSGPPGTS
jgi:excisionase family DNA binding protein